MTFLKTILITLGLCVLIVAQGQDSLARIYGTVISFENETRQGESVNFVSLKTGETYSAVSNTEGKFELGLPFDQEYLIKIVGFQFEQDYAQISIPALKENQSGYSFNVTIEFDPPRTFTLNNVQFKSASAELTKASYAELQDLLDYLLMKKDVVVEISGHTDNIGPADENLTLSKQRAESVRSYLIKNGIQPNQVVAKGYGETDPIATNDTDAGRQKNRRTEVKIISD